MSQFNATDIPLFIKMGFELYDCVLFHVYKMEKRIMFDLSHFFELIYTIKITDRVYNKAYFDHQNEMYR